MDTINDDYILRRYGIGVSPESRDALKNAMLKYGNNYWWESKDSIELAKYQLFEKILMIDMSTFHEGLERLLGRKIITHEFALNLGDIKEEAKLRLKRTGQIIGISQECLEEAQNRSIQTLENYCGEQGKKFMRFDS